MSTQKMHGSSWSDPCRITLMI